MADPIRKQTIDALTVRMQTITEANGYASNLGDHVIIMPVASIALDDLPAVTVHDMGNTITPWSLNQCQNVIDCEIRIIFATGTYTRDDIYTAIRDVYTAIALDPFFGGQAIDTEPVSDTIEIDEKEDTIGRAVIKIRITYTAQRWTF